MKIRDAVQSFVSRKPRITVGGDPLWTLIEDRHNLGVELRRPYEQKWYICLAFYVSRQYTFFNQSAWVLQQLRNTKGHTRHVDNQLMPRVRRQIADGIAYDPIMSVVPSTDEQEDIEAAKVGDRVLRSLWRTLKMRTQMRKTRLWIHTTGNCFLGDRWDPKAGPVKRGQDGTLSYSGDVAIDVWSPFEILVPYTTLGSDELDKFNWMETVKHKSLDQIYKEFEEEVSAESLSQSYVDISHLFGLARGASAFKTEGALVKQLFIQPCKDFPKGICITGANGKVFKKHIKDFPFDFYPFEQFKDIEVPGVFWGSATMEHGISLQKIHNRTLSSMDEYLSKLGKAKGLAPRKSRLEKMPDDLHGEWILYNPVMGHKPEISVPRPLPHTYGEVLNIVAKSFQDLFSQQEVTKGTNRSDIRSGEMVEILLDQNAMGGIPTFAIQEDSLERLFGRVLKRVQVGYETERMMKITGREQEFEVFSFKGADLRGNTDVTVASEKGKPGSRAVRNLMVERRFEKGMYGDPMDPEVRREVMNLLDDAAIKDTFAETRRDEQVARLENRLLSSGQVNLLVCNEYDNHAVHVKEHDKFRKNLTHQRMKFANPNVFQKIELGFRKHQGQHQMFLEQMQRAAMEQAVAMKGGGR